MQHELWPGVGQLPDGTIKWRRGEEKVWFLLYSYLTKQSYPMELSGDPEDVILWVRSKSVEKLVAEKNLQPLISSE